MSKKQMQNDTTPLSDHREGTGVSLPDNAFRELQPGEQYEPLMSPDRSYAEA